RRGRVTGSEVRAGATVVTATVPLAELFGYATRVRSRTRGRGTFTSRPPGYAPAPAPPGEVPLPEGGGRVPPPRPPARGAPGAGGREGHPVPVRAGSRGHRRAGRSGVGHDRRRHRVRPRGR